MPVTMTGAELDRYSDDQLRTGGPGGRVCPGLSRHKLRSLMRCGPVAGRGHDGDG